MNMNPFKFLITNSKIITEELLKKPIKLELYNKMEKIWIIFFIQRKVF